MMFRKYCVSILMLVAVSAAPSFAHPGRRFQVEVVDNQLRAQGVNTISNAVQADAPFNTTGSPVVIDPRGLRPYFGAVHAHFEDGGGTQIPQTDLPGYGLSLGTEVLETYDVFLTVTGASKWENVRANLTTDSSSGLSVPAFVRDGTDPTFVPLGAGEFIQIQFTDPVTSNSQVIRTDDPGSTLKFVSNFDGVVSVDGDGIANNTSSNGYDRDLDYFFGGTTALSPVDTIYVVETELSTNAPGVADSDTVYTIISPDGVNLIDRLHFASLFAEETLGTSTVIPEPATAALLVMGAIGLVSRRRRSRA